MKIIDVIEEQTGLSIEAELFLDRQPLPMYLLNKRNIYHAVLNGVEFIIVEIQNPEALDLKKMKLQMAKYQDFYKQNVAFAFEKTDRLQRNAMIRNFLPFITESGQIYLPFLGVCLNNAFYKMHKQVTKRFSPVTQCMFLYLLYQKREAYAKERIAEALNVTKAAVSKASCTLYEAGLTMETRRGKNVYVERVADGYEYFLAAREYLLNPVQKENYYSIPDAKGILAGESALSEYSMLNPPMIPTYAVHKDSGSYVNESPVDVQWNDADDVIRVQFWKYDPTLFPVEGKADPVSLYCTLKNVTDERVLGELENVLEEYKWL